MTLRWLRLSMVSLTLAAATAVPALASTLSSTGATSAGDERRLAVDLKVAIRTNDSCGKLGDSLPVLVAQTELQPGHFTPPVVVCAANRGSSDAQLTLGATEMIQTDQACSRDESSVDITCGGNQTGELASSLIVLLATQPACKGPFGTITEIILSELPETAVPVFAAMKNNRVHCVALSLQYRPSSTDLEAASQTDSVHWRYAFDLST